MEKATFGAGCFWGVEATFMEIKGVHKTLAGYMGGILKNPSYQEVCTDRTGHAEVVYLEYDPQLVSYETLLTVFWENHDPTTPNQQGPDIGSQYRSAVFFYNEEQKQIAEQMKEDLNLSGKYRNPIVTEITKASDFWKAEEYHQKYYEKKGIKKQCGIPSQAKQ